jgi:hyperosmotically inducible protein
MKNRDLIKMLVLTSVLLCSSQIHAAKAVTTTQTTTTTEQQPAESTDFMADSMITAKVKTAFVREKLFGKNDLSIMGVTVTTTNSIVYLTGTVDTQAEADSAVSVAKAVEGVSGVESSIVVK